MSIINVIKTSLGVRSPYTALVGQGASMVLIRAEARLLLKYKSTLKVT